MDAFWMVAGRGAEHPEPFPLPIVLEQSIGRIRPMFRGAGLQTFRLAAPGPLPQDWALTCTSLWHKLSRMVDFFVRFHLSCYNSSIGRSVSTGGSVVPEA